MSRRSDKIKAEMDHIQQAIIQKRNLLDVAVDAGVRRQLRNEMNDLKRQWKDMQSAYLMSFGRTDDGKRIR